jgi:protein FRA10AC1
MYVTISCLCLQVPFQYSEGGETKLELVKVRLCPSCAEKLFFHSISTSKSTEKKRETSERKQHSSESDYPALSSSAESRSVASDSKKKRKLSKS